MTLEDVAGLVCERLTAAGISVVLSGGAVVSIYSENEYESLDLDFVREGLASNVDATMRSLGFVKTARHWRHPGTRYWVEFPPGPVAVGEEPVREVATRETGLGVLRLLPPTECVMDRLVSFYHWGDRQALDQAVAVATRQPVDLARIRAWSRREGPEGERLREFEDRLQTRRG